MLFEAASDVTANILFTATELEMLFRLTQHFMRTLSRRTRFYALIAVSKNWKKSILEVIQEQFFGMFSGKQWGELFPANQNI